MSTRVVEVVPVRIGEPLRLPLLLSRVPAGFPSPADDYIEEALDLNELLIRHPAATFFMRVEGDSMVGAGIHSGDLLIVDRAIEPRPGYVVVAAVCGELTVKRLKLHEGRLCLMPEDGSHEPLPIREEMEVVIWGVVTCVIHPLV